MLGIIGRGGYGEIWLARSLTNALRAVKVVYRDTFDSERTFNREFEGMSAFEPISRAHDGFVDILHVGRSVSGRFFYYVMELADDQETGHEIEITRYTPKTLKAELGHTLPADECLRLGLLLAEALGALHREGLAHRDIKPSNIIFVQGVPKLADIGLVAASGQQSFVGTEGYVPPEGPGTPQADLYSLGKVLYEISMGKDRLDFPELSSNLDERADKERLLQLNDVLLKACAHQPARRYVNAEEMQRDLARIAAGKSRPRRSWLRLFLVIAALLLLAAGAWAVWRAASHQAPPAGPADVTIMTDPSGAMVVLDDRMERSPATFRSLAPGKYPLRVMLPDYDPLETVFNVPPAPSAPPVFKLARSRGSAQLTSIPPGAKLELRRAGESPRHARTPALLRDLPTGPYEVVAKEGDWELKGHLEVKRGEVTLKAFRFANGSAKIISAPGGAMVSLGGKELGRTPLLLDEVKPGEVSYHLQLEGFKPAEVRGTISPNEQTFLASRLEKKLSPVRGKAWENSLGMRFVAVAAWHMSAWETRVRDWAAFTAATGRAPTTVDFPQTENDPAVKVNWSDAMAFCQWLTEKERRENFLDESERYRLPTDAEWSEAAGLPNEEGATPEERDGRERTQFPWGTAWPPPRDAGNYGQIENRNDGHPATAPAGSFAPNAAGIYDLGGNVWEWCFDLYKPGSRWGVLRGGSWSNTRRGELLTSYRNVVERSERDVIYGFRCVLITEEDSPR